jgi:hypothetical protein
MLYRSRQRVLFRVNHGELNRIEGCDDLGLWGRARGRVGLYFLASSDRNERQHRGKGKTSIWDMSFHN